MQFPSGGWLGSSAAKPPAFTHFALAGKRLLREEREQRQRTFTIPVLVLLLDDAAARIRCAALISFIDSFTLGSGSMSGRAWKRGRDRPALARAQQAVASPHEEDDQRGDRGDRHDCQDDLHDEDRAVGHRRVLLEKGSALVRNRGLGEDRVQPPTQSDSETVFGTTSSTSIRFAVTSNRHRRRISCRASCLP